MNRLLMDNVPTWSNKEVLYAFGSVAGALIPALFALYRLLSGGLRHRLIATKENAAILTQKLNETSIRLDDAQRQAERLSEELTDVVRELSLTKELLANTTADLEQSQGRFLAEQRRVTRALEADGFTWTERVLHNAPEFRPLETRRMPIISVLNLKGGVGKTTLTANLGAALSRRGWKVLLIDIDLQGSLTSLYVSEEEQAALENKRRFLGEFLTRSFDAEYPNLLDYRRPILAPSASALVGTVDTLAYAETNLTVRWLLREGNRDPRFLLRRELHLRRISNEFDIVLIDCPPLINVSCVNALAASDTVLIPVMPSKQAIDRVPVLLARILQFRQNINENLKILGFVPSRTWRSELTSEEENRMSELEIRAKNTWGEAVARFESIIPQSTEVRKAEDEHRPLSEGEQLYASFERLAREVEGRLPTFCRGTGVPTLLNTGVLQ